MNLPFSNCIATAALVLARWRRKSRRIEARSLHVGLCWLQQCQLLGVELGFHTAPVLFVRDAGSQNARIRRGRLCKLQLYMKRERGTSVNAWSVRRNSTSMFSQVRPDPIWNKSGAPEPGIWNWLRASSSEELEAAKDPSSATARFLDTTRSNRDMADTTNQL